MKSGYGREDLQDDTFLMISRIIAGAMGALLRKDVEMLHGHLEVLYLTLADRFSKEERQEIEEELLNINARMYGPSRVRSPQEVSAVLDLTKALYTKIMVVLDKKGILLRTRTDINSIITAGSH